MKYSFINLEAFLSNTQEENKNPNGNDTVDTFVIEKLDLIKEWLKAIKEINVLGFINTANWCFLPNIILPPKFKMPKFKKYNGLSCPRVILLYFEVRCSSLKRWEIANVFFLGKFDRYFSTMV